MKETTPLDDILVQAEEDENQPPDPPGGIPRQRLPGWIRWPLRVLAMPWILLDLYAQKLAALIVRPPYRQEGSCLKRGNCCRFILLPEAKGILGRLNFLLNTELNGFYPRYKEPHEYDGKKIIVMGCRYLKKDGGCAHYHLRPVVCRRWPQIAIFGQPRILKGCGFRAVPRDRKKKSPLDLVE